MGDLSPRAYYDRQLRVSGWGREGQEILARSTVLVVGVGGLGCPALMALARSGVGRLVFADPDRVEASNLSRQILFSTADVGRPKTEAAAEALSRANPWIRLEGHPYRVDASNVRAFVEDADLVIDGTDNFRTKFLLHDACLSAGRPLVLGSLYQWEAHLSVFPFHEDRSGCWRCLYRTEPEDGCVGVCADVGVAGALASLAGNAEALAAVRTLLRLAPPPHPSTWIFDAVRWESRRLRWKPDPACSCGRRRGDWSWLAASAPREAEWERIDPRDRQVVVDVREAEEIRAGEWERLAALGSRVIHHPWSAWRTDRPRWEAGTTYLLVCERGARSLAALKTVPPGIAARSLAGGMSGWRASIAVR